MDARLQLRSLGPPVSGLFRTQCPSATEVIVQYLSTIGNRMAAHRKSDRHRPRKMPCNLSHSLCRFRIRLTAVLFFVKKTWFSDRWSHQGNPIRDECKTCTDTVTIADYVLLS